MKRFGMALAGAGVLLVLVAGGVLAYKGQVPTQVTVSGPTGAIVCGRAMTVSATVLDVNGKPVDHQKVTWSFTSSKPGDKINHRTTTTNAHGVATTSVTLACVAGRRSIQAKAGDAFAFGVLDLVSSGLPNTSTGTPATPVWQLLLAAMAVLIGAGLGLREVFARR